MRGLETLAKAWKAPDLRRKIVFTLLMLVVFRVGSNIPVPGIDRAILKQTFENGGNGLIDLFNLFSGGAFSRKKEDFEDYQVFNSSACDNSSRRSFSRNVQRSFDK